jgi:hypothetical protein
MKIYRYDQQYYFYLGEDYAQADPDDPQNYIMPPGSTTLEPPKFSDGCIAVFNPLEEYWEVVVDKRGCYYCIDTKNIVNNDNPCCNMDGYTNLCPHDPIDSNHEIIWDGTQWEQKLKDGIKSLAELSFEEKIGKILNLNTNDFVEKISDKLKDSYNGSLNSLLSRFNISKETVKSYLEVSDGDADINAAFNQFFNITFKDAILQNMIRHDTIEDVLNNLTLDPYELRDYLNSLPAEKPTSPEN